MKMYATTRQAIADALSAARDDARANASSSAREDDRVAWDDWANAYHHAAVAARNGKGIAAIVRAGLDNLSADGVASEWERDALAAIDRAKATL